MLLTKMLRHLIRVFNIYAFVLHQYFANIFLVESMNYIISKKKKNILSLLTNFFFIWLVLGTTSRANKRAFV